MATKRTPLRRDIKRRVTPAAIEAFRAGDHKALNRALGIKLWEPSPLGVDGPEPPEWAKNDGTGWTAAWPKIWEIRQALEAAIRERQG